MAFFNEFPHTRFYDADLGWIIKKIGILLKGYDSLESWRATHEAEYEELAKKVEGLINNLIDVIVPWDASKEYMPFDIVEWEGTNYIAVQEVPIGTMITNTDYWQPANTVTEQINAIGIVVNELQEKKIIVTPEDFGAVGDGVADDTTAWQNAIDSGYQVVATSGTYKVGQLDVNRNGIVIDCNGAEFTCTSDILFNVEGTVTKTIMNAPSYSEGSTDYYIGENYTGYGMITSVTPSFTARSYYWAGMVGFFVNGVFADEFPFDATNDVRILEVAPAENITIKNIKNVVFTDSQESYVIDCKYGVHCHFEHINVDSMVYSVVHLYRSLGCVVKGCNIHTPTFVGTYTYNYPINIGDSCYCVTRDCYIHNEYWHCWTTGQNYINKGNIIENCQMFTDVEAGAIVDHANGYNTIIRDTTTNGITVYAGSVIDNVTMTENRTGRSFIVLACISKKEIANYSVKNVRFRTSATPNAMGIYLRDPGAQTTGNIGYYNNVMIENVYNETTLTNDYDLIRLYPTSWENYSSVKLYNINIQNVNMGIIIQKASNAVIDMSEAVMIVKDCQLPRNNAQAHYIDINAPADGKLIVENCHIRASGGERPAIRIYNNIIAEMNLYLESTEKTIGSNIYVKGSITSQANTNMVFIENMYLETGNRIIQTMWRTSSASNTLYSKILTAANDPVNWNLTV